MKCFVTGAAGFIGSRLSESLIEKGHNVLGVDCFTDYYPRPIKEANLLNLKGNPSFSFIEEDIIKCNLDPLLKDVDWVFHLAAQAGVRASWGSQFEIYVDCNIRTTQRLLEFSKNKPIRKFVYASSSSVYGDTENVPTAVDSRLNPRSPYGVTKLAAENLCSLYHANFGMPTVSPRYFTVFGPRQRPDMAMHRFLRSCVDGSKVPIFGDGSQTRDFTYVDDIVSGTILAAEKGAPGRIFNLGGGNRINVKDLLALISDVAGKAPNIVRDETQAGDVRNTWADTTLARSELGWAPSFSLREGLKRELDWVRKALDSGLLPPMKND